MMMTTTRYHWMLLVSLLLIFGCISESQQLIIKKIKIPSLVKIGDVEHVILDCDYALENTSTKGLVVKWFFNDNQLVYQWIHGRSPLADEPVKKYVDLTYRASDDPFTEYRAMKLDKPGVDLSGDYKCVISTFEDEQTANASMVMLYLPELAFTFEYQKKFLDNKEGVEVTCKAEGVHPQPTLEISVFKAVPQAKTPQLVMPQLPTSSGITFLEGGLFNFVSRADYLDEDLPEMAEFKCILNMPKANYSRIRKTSYYAGTTTTTTSTDTTIIWTQHKMDTQALDSSIPRNGGGNFVDRASINLILLPILLAIFIQFH